MRIEFDANEGLRGYYDRLLAYTYIDEDMDCDDFETQAEAKDLHETHTGHGLDGDGIAYESLP